MALRIYWLQISGSGSKIVASSRGSITRKPSLSLSENKAISGGAAANEDGENGDQIVGSFIRRSTAFFPGEDKEKRLQNL
jgi:hypothetical protein